MAFSRPLGFVALAGIFLGMFILPPTGIELSTCGFHRSTGLPCVGCGLTRSVTCFLQGQFSWAMAYHPLGPVFAVMFVLMGAMAVLPMAWRDALIARIERWDKVLGAATVLFVVLLIGYGLFRLSLVASGDPDLAWWRTSEAPPFVTME